MRESRYNVWVEYQNLWYVHNGVSGAVLSMTAEQRRALLAVIAGDPGASPSPQLLADATIGRMVVGEGDDERDVLEARYRRSRDDASALGLTIVTSLGCNFDCPYCFEAKHPSIIDAGVEEAILAVVDDQIEDLEHLSVTWFGGEPLVGKRPLLNLSDAFIDRCDAHGVDYSASIITNGYLLNAEMCEDLASRRVRSVQIGLDGPPDVHNRFRPLASGGPTFDRIVENLHHAVSSFNVAVRVNIDASNVHRTLELLDILDDEGLAHRVHVYLGHLVGSAAEGNGPNATYGKRFLTVPEFAAASLEFDRECHDRGYGEASVPRPVATPCVAVRRNSLVVGSEGQLYKCWDSVGSDDVIGDIRDYASQNSRVRRWLAYDPFSDEECRECVALPVCMGGCAHHAMDQALRADRCGTFRTTHREQVLDLVKARAGSGRLSAQPGRREVSVELTRGSRQAQFAQV